MDNISISKLKINPAAAINKASDFPLAIESRNKVKAYLLGKDLYEKNTSYIENYIDASYVKSTDFSKGKDLDKIAEELGI